MATKVDVTNELETRFDGLKDNVKHLVDGVPEKASAFRAQAMNSIEYIGAQIKKHPMAALGIAFGAGFLVMRLVRR